MRTATKYIVTPEEVPAYSPPLHSGTVAVVRKPFGP